MPSPARRHLNESQRAMVAVRVANLTRLELPQPCGQDASFGVKWWAKESTLELGKQFRVLLLFNPREQF